jgi:hypothetical protein
MMGCPVGAFFGGEKKESEADKAKQSLQAGLNMMKDPAAVKDAMAALNDPATKREVEKLLKDPAFAKELERMKSNPQYKATVEGAKAAMADPQLAARISSQVNQQGEMSDVQLGMAELAKTAKNVSEMFLQCLQQWHCIVCVNSIPYLTCAPLI